MKNERRCLMFQNIFNILETHLSLTGLD